MAHVELSISEAADPRSTPPRGFGASVDLWAAAVAAATEPCLLLDGTGAVVAASPGCASLLGVDLAAATGRRLVDGVLRLLDFNAVSGELPGWEVDKIPPLLAIATGGLARGLIRVAGEDSASTVDAVSTPLRERAAVVGSLTFFAPVGR